LQGVPFSVREGEVALVTGPCGSGKSTLLKVLAGIIPHVYTGFRVSGIVKVFGLSPLEATEKGLVAYVPQDIYTFFIASHACEELEVLRLPLEGFTQLCDKPIEVLSDGQLYRLLTHIAIGSGARLLLLDEPTSHLDSETLAEVVAMLKSAAVERGATVIIADHRVSELKSLVDTVVELGKDREESASDGSWRAYDERRTAECQGLAARVKGLTLSLDGVTLVKGLSFDVAKGSALGILGRNGVGKSTLLKALLRLTSFTAEGIYIERPAFYISQKPLYWFSTGSVRAELTLYAKLFGKKAEEVEEVAELFQLNHLLHRNPYTLSVGEARRLAMALAFIASPRLLLFDEPLLGLDKSSEELFQELLESLKKRCSAAIVASHSKKLVELVDSCLELLPGGEVRFCA
jgi:ABC-type multidrug transport system ATPase subunit